MHTRARSPASRAEPSPAVRTPGRGHHSEGPRGRSMPPANDQRTICCGAADRLLRLAQHVAEAANRVNEARLAPCFELLPQMADADVERVGARAEVEAPDAREDEPARQHLARVL